MKTIAGANYDNILTGLIFMSMFIYLMCMSYNVLGSTLKSFLSRSASIYEATRPNLSKLLTGVYSNVCYA